MSAYKNYKHLITSNEKVAKTIKEFRKPQVRSNKRRKRA